ncbi:MAG: hypothetical protein ABIS91_24595 [Nocardioides sp.]|uniref:hypothetical protein n=1 Tax=Nocardioides sp. TaxID=35761 RepID=UPI0032650F3C
MTIALPLGWTGSFDQDTAVLRLAPSDGASAATVSFGPAPDTRGDGLLDRATDWLEADIHRRDRLAWQDSLGRLRVGARAQLDTRSAGVGEVANGDASGFRRSRRTGEIAVDGRAYRVRQKSRWRADVELEGHRIAVLRRRALSRRTRALDRTPLPAVETAAVTETDQLAVVLAACVMGPPGRTGFWGEVCGHVVPWLP